MGSITSLRSAWACAQHGHVHSMGMGMAWAWVWHGHGHGHNAWPMIPSQSLAVMLVIHMSAPLYCPTGHIGSGGSGSRTQSLGGPSMAPEGVRAPVRATYNGSQICIYFGHIKRSPINKATLSYFNSIFWGQILLCDRHMVSLYYLGMAWSQNRNCRLGVTF